MSNDDKLRTDLSRAQRAKEWLENPLYAEAWEAARMVALAKLEDLPLQDKDGREEIHHMLSGMKKVRAYIERAVQDGKLAKVELESARLSNKVRRFVGR